MGNALNLSGIAVSPKRFKWKRTAQQLATETLFPRSEEVDREGRFPVENIRALGEAGLMGLMVPEEMGGPGGDILTTALVIEQLAQGCASTAMSYAMHSSIVPLLVALADDGQRERILAPMVRGEVLFSVAMSEPGSGNRLWHMDTYAQQNGQGYIIDSFKSFATSCGYSDYFLVPLRASSESRSDDLSLFVIDARDKNVKPIGVWDGMGLRGNSSRPVHFDKCQVPAENRLGSPTCGFSMMFAYTLPVYQVGLAAVYLGIAQAAYHVAVEHVKKRIHSDTNTSLARMETIQRYIAEMNVRLDQARHLVYRVAQMSDNALVLFNELQEAELLDEIIRKNPDDPFFVEVAQVKISACEMATDVTNKALQVCGGTGYKRGHPVERCYRDARAGSVMGPADDTLKLIVGRQILGIPQPWDLD